MVEEDVEVHSEIPQAAYDAAPVAEPPAAETETVNLHNRYAVRSALLAGLAAFFLSAPLGALGLLVLIAGGVFAVFLYRKSTGQLLSVANGARLGWITGIFLFALLLLTFTASVALEPTFFTDLETQIASRSTLPPNEVRQIMDMLRTPMGIAAMVLGMFVSSTLPPAIGGAVGAKLLGRN